MRRPWSLIAIPIFALAATAKTRIDDPAKFVTSVYRNLTGPRGENYRPPEDIYTPRLAALIREDRRLSKEEVGCLDFLFWVNGQDWVIRGVKVTVSGAAPDRQTVVASFVNQGRPAELHFDFRRIGGNWLLDDAECVTEPKWKLSELLKCRGGGAARGGAGGGRAI